MSTASINEGNQKWFRRGANRISYYSWPAKVAEQTILLIHGYGGHARFEFLRHVRNHRNFNDSCSVYDLVYEGSLIEKLNNSNLSVYALDLQSHGTSTGWNDTRCNVESFEEGFVYDVLFLIIELGIEQISLLGISMGGCIAVRVLQTLNLLKEGKNVHCRSKWLDFNETSFCFLKKLTISNVILLAPMLSLNEIQKSFWNKILLNFLSFASRFFPHLALGQKPLNNMFPECEAFAEHDKMCYKGRIRARIAYECLKAVETVRKDMQYCRCSRILIIHAFSDTMCEVKGSKDLFEELQGSTNLLDNQQYGTVALGDNVEKASYDIFGKDSCTLWLVKGMWHWLLKEEPYCYVLMQHLVNWLCRSQNKAEK